MTIRNAIDQFILHCRFEKNLSIKTMKAYETDLLQFNLALNRSLLIDQISRENIKEYLASISSFKPKTINRKIATIKVFFSFLEFESKIDINPFHKMKARIKEPVVLRTVLDLKDIIKIFKIGYKLKSKVANKSSYSYFEALRNIVVLELLFATGARVSEIANLNMENINVYSGNIVIKGKGNKERIIQICNNETLMVLQKYYQLSEGNIIKSGGWFLINRFNKKLSDQSIRNLVSKLTKNIGIPKHITPHVFRHTFATLLLEKDVDIKYIQSLLGHSSITTTQIYTHVTRKRQRQILTAKHPRRDFTMVFD